MAKHIRPNLKASRKAVSSALEADKDRQFGRFKWYCFMQWINGDAGCPKWLKKEGHDG